MVHEPPDARSHAIIVSTAAVGLLLVALLAAAMTPGGSPDEVASPTGPSVAEVASFATTPGMAVPIEGGARALMAQPERAVAPGEAVTAELPTGVTVRVVVTATDRSGLVVVSLPADAPVSYRVAPTAVEVSGPDDTVHVGGAEAVTIEALRALELADGTPLTDDAGNLVGLCVEDRSSGATTVLVIDRARVDAIGG